MPLDSISTQQEACIVADTLRPSQDERQSLLESERGRRILARARDDTSSLLWLKDTDSACSSRSKDSASSSLSKLDHSFTFDPEVLSSKVYRNTLASFIKQDISRKNTQSDLSDPNTSTTLAVTTMGGTLPPGSQPESLLDFHSCQQVMHKVPEADVVESDDNDEFYDDETIRITSGMNQSSSVPGRPDARPESFQAHLLDCRLSEAVIANNLDMVKQLLADPGNPQVHPRAFPWSLRTAIDQESLEAVNLLLDHGINVQAVDAFARTPLIYACSRGQTAIAESLLDRGADLEAKNFSGETALHAACLTGHSSTIKLLLNRGANTEARNQRRETPLHYVSLWGAAADAQSLIDKGADVKAISISNESPLSYAICHAHSAVVGVLVNAMKLSSLEDFEAHRYLSLIRHHLDATEHAMRCLETFTAHFVHELRTVAGRLRNLARCAEPLLCLGTSIDEAHLELYSSVCKLVSAIPQSKAETTDLAKRQPPQLGLLLGEIDAKHFLGLSQALGRTTDEDLYTHMMQTHHIDQKRNKSVAARRTVPYRVAKRLSERLRHSNSITIDTYVEVRIDSSPTSISV